MAARRPRKTDRSIKDFQALLNAMKAIKIDKKSRKSTAQAYNINMRSLGRYVQKFDAKRMKKTALSSSDESDADCMICSKTMSKKLNRNNSIKCHTCKAVVHAKCVNMRFSVYTCPNCDSDDDLE